MSDTDLGGDYVAVCERCGLEVGVENQSALDTLLAMLEAGPRGDGHVHAFEQTAPEARR